VNADRLLARGIILPSVQNRKPRPISNSASGCGLARALSKLGYCSRKQARELIEAGRVRVGGVVRLDPEWRVNPSRDCIEVDGSGVRTAKRVYLMLNKPRGLVTTTADEKGRGTVLDCLAGAGLPWVAPVGRLDQASEGLLLLTNDTAWSARLTDPASHVEKTYHIQIDRIADEELARKMCAGVISEGEKLAAKAAGMLRRGDRNSWIEVILDEGRNRHLRRLLGELGVEVLRLVRVAIGAIPLGSLPKGAWRHLTPEEIGRLGCAGTSTPGNRHSAVPAKPQRADPVKRV
jgi:23S rRNA pseudouridine2605 synthase